MKMRHAKLRRWDGRRGRPRRPAEPKVPTEELVARARVEALFLCGSTDGTLGAPCKREVGHLGDHWGEGEGDAGVPGHVHAIEVLDGARPDNAADPRW